MIRRRAISPSTRQIIKNQRVDQLQIPQIAEWLGTSASAAEKDIARAYPFRVDDPVVEAAVCLALLYAEDRSSAEASGRLADGWLSYPQERGGVWAYHRDTNPLATTVVKLLPNRRAARRRPGRSDEEVVIRHLWRDRLVPWTALQAP